MLQFSLVFMLQERGPRQKTRLMTDIITFGVGNSTILNQDGKRKILSYVACFYSKFLAKIVFWRAASWLSSNIVNAMHSHYAKFTKTYGLYPSHNALQVRTLSGVVASVYTPLPTRTQQLPTLLAQQCWVLLRLFACSLRLFYLKSDTPTCSTKLYSNKMPSQIFSW